jgi:hypothetical protein
MFKSLHWINQLTKLVSVSEYSEVFILFIVPLLVSYFHKISSLLFRIVESVLSRILNWLAISFFSLPHLVTSLIMFTFSAIVNVTNLPLRDNYKWYTLKNNDIRQLSIIL